MHGYVHSTQRPFYTTSNQGVLPLQPFIKSILLPTTEAYPTTSLGKIAGNTRRVGFYPSTCAQDTNKIITKSQYGKGITHAMVYPQVP
jgi:hypothetical protein